LYDHLRRHFADQPGIEVIVQRRVTDRRRGADRRQGVIPVAADRRLIRNADGRRIGEQRASAFAAAVPALPRRARAHVQHLSFVETVRLTSEQREDDDTGRLVTRIQSGDRDAFELLYLRYFDRVYAHVQMLLRDPHETEDTTQQVFLNLLSGIARYERRGAPFRAWLFTIVRNLCVDRLRSMSKLDVVDPHEHMRSLEADSSSMGEFNAVLGQITDRDLLLFIERLPLVQRQVLMLRYMLDLGYGEIGAILERSPNEVRKIQQRAVSFLRARLSSVGARSRAPLSRRPASWRRRPTLLVVIRARRYALLP